MDADQVRVWDAELNSRPVAVGEPSSAEADAQREMMRQMAMPTV